MVHDIWVEGGKYFCAVCLSESIYAKGIYDIQGRTFVQSYVIALVIAKNKKFTQIGDFQLI